MTLPLLPEDSPTGNQPHKTVKAEAAAAITWDMPPPGAQPNETGTLPLHPGVQTVFAANPPPMPGYEILEILGRGGMGVVYKARDTRLQRVVALKMILSGAHADDAELTRFRNEAESVARLQHPGIVQIYEVGEHQGLPFFSLEYCPGGSLASQLDGTPRPPKQAARLVEQLARAMHVAHTNHVIHRDLKPGNVLLDSSGEPKISDFGLAKKLDEAGQTQSGSVLGTPSYMAPEQASGRTGQTGPAADVYALGAILYELLTGRPPFKGPTAVDTILQVTTTEPVPPIHLQPHTPRDLDTICLKCLQKSPGNRYATAEDLAEDLRRFQASEPIHARPVSAMERSWRWCRRNPAVAMLLTAVAAALLLGTAVASWFALEAHEERRRADEKAALAQDNEQRALEQKRAAEDARRQSDKDRDLALKAEHQGQEKLLQAHLAEAKAQRFSGQSGQRFQSLAALTRAAELARRLNKPASLFDEMRNLAIAALALPDVRLEKEWHGWPEGSYGLHFDDRLEHYVRSDLEGNVTVRRVADDVEVARLSGPAGKIACSFGRDRLASCVILFHHADRSLKLWNFKTNKQTQLATLPADDLVTWHVTADGLRLVVIHKDAALTVFELPSGRQLRQIRVIKGIKPNEAVLEHHFCDPHPFLHQLAISLGLNGGQERGVIRVVDLDTGQVLTELRRTPLEAASHLGWLPDGKSLAVGYTQTVDLWNVATGKVVHSFKEHKGGGLWTSVNYTGECLLTWSVWAGGMKLWHPQTHRLLLSMPNHEVFCTDSTRDGRLWGYRIDGRRIQLWVIDPARECRTLVRDPSRIDVSEYRLNAIHPDGRLAAVGTTRGVTLLDLTTGVDVGFLNLGHNWNVAFDPSTGDLLTCGSKGLFRWPVQVAAGGAGQLRIGPPQRLPLDVRQMDHVVRISANGKTLAAAQGNSAVIWHQDEPGRRFILEPLVVRREIALSPDGQLVATGYFAQSGHLRVWNTKDGTLVKAFGAQDGMNVCFSPDGQWLLANDPTHYHFWRVGTWEKGPQAPIPWKYWEGEPAFSPDGLLLALERGDGAVRLIEVATGRELAVLEDLQQGRSTHATFSPDGTHLLLTNKDYQVLRVWDLRKLREGLQTLGLDWHAPKYPAATACPGLVVPLTVEIDAGDKASSDQRSRTDSAGR